MTPPSPNWRTRLLHRIWVAALVCISWCAAPAVGADVLYATGNAPGVALSGLHEVDPDTGDNHLLWGFASDYLYAGGLAYDAATDLLYVAGARVSDPGTSRLYSIDRFNGALIEIGPMGEGINLTSGGLAVHPLTGVMYATGGNGHQSTGLFTVDKGTGTATLIGQSGGQCCIDPFGFNMNGLGFGSDGTLWANGFTLSDGASSLYTLNLATAAATLVGAHGVSGGRELKYSGLAFRADGTLLSLGSFDAASGALYSVDPVTGAATSLTPPGPYGSGPVHFGVDGGLVFAPGTPVPEPASTGLLLAGLAAMALWRQHRAR